MPEQRKVVTAVPENSETPLDGVRSWVTPTRLFFVRNHFAVPPLDLATWRLSVEGRVKRPRAWTWDELGELPERTVFATVECAGNGRSFLAQRQAGVQWGAGAVGHAEWTGVPLRLVLERSGLEPDAVEVLFEGADVGSESDHPEPMPFERSLPLDKALHPDTLLAFRMNGEPLDPIHGYPLRLFVPGWYGVASVKWLRRVAVLDRPFRGYFQSVKYTVERRTARGVETEVVGPMMPKSEVIRPRAGDALGLGGNRFFGVAWSGEDSVSRVEVSTDGGTTWNDATLMGPQAPYSWTLWEYLWEAESLGDYTILVRATSSRGRVQPAEHDALNGGYLIHHSRPLPVRVTVARPGQFASPPQAGRLAGAEHADAHTIMYDMNAYAEENMRLPLDVEMEFSAGGGI
jgi:DMSO/TMAO reductase YedYZ molybdopterin-dependent catalytic subunit